MISISDFMSVSYTRLWEFLFKCKFTMHYGTFLGLLPVFNLYFLDPMSFFPCHTLTFMWSSFTKSRGSPELCLKRGSLHSSSSLNGYTPSYGFVLPPAQITLFIWFPLARYLLKPLLLTLHPFSSCGFIAFIFLYCHGKWEPWRVEKYMTS